MSEQMSCIVLILNTIIPKTSNIFIKIEKKVDENSDGFSLWNQNKTKEKKTESITNVCDCDFYL